MGKSLIFTRNIKIFTSPEALGTRKYEQTSAIFEPRVVLLLWIICVLCLVFLMLSRLFIAAIWSPTEKELTSWLLLVMFIVILLLSHVVSWVRCAT